MARTRKQHSEDSRGAAYAMWANVADRTERLRNAHGNSPSGTAWHARRLFGADVDLDALTTTQWNQAEQARLMWLRANSVKATKQRRLEHAERLEKRAATIRAEVGGDGL